MVRPHIEFIQSQMLPWQDGLYAPGRSGVESKTFSTDAGNGAASVLIRYPGGWAQESAGYLSADEELFVLEGSLEINGRTYGEFGYAFLPAGYARQSFASPEGAVVLTFFESTPEFVTGAAADLFDASRLVEYVDGLNQPYDNDFARMGSEGVNQAGIALKLLREDPHDREQTWLLGAVAFWPGGAIEIHPVVEELFLVSGEIVGPFGSMKSGAYFWRPPDVPHGPFATAAPTLHFFRTKGGPLSTTFLPPDSPLAWDTPYNPVVPPELAQLAGATWQADTNY
ncbi:MAG TPA: DUF4437 domain-containing protein [Alphaproteobacteria bacterium]|jgi:hypothetical protein|nr:DUF4437 domain-containing protein [Alphaproteobacteria bacterium]